MTEKKNEIVAVIGKALPDMTQDEKTYLMGFLEGFAALVSNKKLAEAERPGA